MAGSDFGRRDVMRSAGVVAAGAGLAACGAAEEAAGGAASAARSAAGSAASAASSAVGNLVAAADVPVGGGRILENLKVVVTQPTEGEFKAFSSVCTHQGCAVTSVENGRIVCPCHGSEFAIADGSVLKGPAEKPLPAKSVEVGSNGISVS